MAIDTIRTGDRGFEVREKLNLLITKANGLPVTVVSADVDVLDPDGEASADIIANADGSHSITFRLPAGRTPGHEIDGFRIRFQKPDGTYGAWIDLGALAAGAQEAADDAEAARDQARGFAQSIDPTAIAAAIAATASLAARRAFFYANVTRI